MATNTTNYNFKKPDESDFYSIQDQNGNWDKADAALKDLDTPNFEDYSGSTAVPDAATAIGNIKSKGKLSTILSNIKAAFRGVCLIGNIVNNCVSSDTNKPLAAAQGKVLMDLYNVLNTNLDDRTAAVDLLSEANNGPIGRRIVNCGSTTLNTPYKANLTTLQSGTAIICMSSINYGSIVYVTAGAEKLFLRSKVNGTWGNWEGVVKGSDIVVRTLNPISQITLTAGGTGELIFDIDYSGYTILGIVGYNLRSFSLQAVTIASGIVAVKNTSQESITTEKDMYIKVLYVKK